MQGFSKDDEGLLGEVGMPSQGSLRMPGPSYESAKLVKRLLQVNHVKYDWQFNDEGFHNHLSHSILAAFSLGASPDMIQETFDLHSRVQKPMCTIRRKITYQNWTRWLGQSEYYSSYLIFFTEELGKYGAAATIERYLFKYREGQMLIRAVSGAIHPLIQIGHGVEFSLDALVAEGLAQACVHSAAVEGLFNEGWPHENATAGSSSAPSAFASAFSHFKALKVPVAATFGSSKESFPATLLRLNTARERHPRLGLSAFTIISHILKDPRLAAGQANRKDDFPRLESAIRNRGELIRAWCSEWIIDPAGGWTEIVEKTEEIFWVASVLVGASSRPGYKPRIDFFMMHALTSAIFLPSMLEVLSPTSRIQLLHSHFRVMIGYWVSRGRPYLYIQETLMAANALPCAPSADPAPKGAIQRGIEKAEGEVEKKEKVASNPEQGLDGETKSPMPSSPEDDAKAPEESSTPNGDEHVDIPLDTPPTDKEVDPMDEVPATSQYAQVNQDDEDASEGFRTPTQSNGEAFASRAASPLPKSSQTERTATSSATSWSDIITAAVDHTDEHVTKMVRSLVFAAQNFGMAPPGAYRSALPGTEHMDGTIFIRLAGLLLKSMGWEHYGEPAGDWDRSVLGFDEAWQDETREILAYTSQEKGKGREVQDLDSRLQSYKIGGNNRSRSNTIFEKRMNYPRYQEKGKGRAPSNGNGNAVQEEEESEQEKLQRKYYEDDETDPNAFGEHQQWAEGVV